MASFQSASIVASYLSPADASRLTGRYETVAKTKSGEEVNVLRSLRHAPQEDLLLQARITPKKVKPTSDDIDGLCDLFQSKVKVSPKNTPRSVSNKSVEEAAKMNLISSPVNMRRTSGGLSAPAAMSAILAEESG
jgi:hypothetical protein